MWRMQFIFTLLKTVSPDKKLFFQHTHSTIENNSKKLYSAYDFIPVKKRSTFTHSFHTVLREMMHSVLLKSIYKHATVFCCMPPRRY